MQANERILDSVLVIRCQLGERAALEELYCRHNPRLGYYLRRLVGDQAAQDVQQEVWLTVMRKLATLRQVERFTVWLYRLARRKAIDRIADAARRRRLTEYRADPPEPAAPEPEFSADDAAELHTAMNGLREEHREVLALKYMEEMSYEEMSQVIGCEVGTIRSRLHWAKRYLRERLENEHGR